MSSRWSVNRSAKRLYNELLSDNANKTNIELPAQSQKKTVNILKSESDSDIDGNFSISTNLESDSDAISNANINESNIK